jgi:hypothetical protein
MPRGLLSRASGQGSRECGVCNKTIYLALGEQTGTGDNKIAAGTNEYRPSGQFRIIQQLQDNTRPIGPRVSTHNSAEGLSAHTHACHAFSYRLV